MDGVLLQNGIWSLRNILKRINCEYCDLPISISEAKAEGRIAIENGCRCIIWCKNCGKLNVIRKENGKT